MLVSDSASVDQEVSLTDDFVLPGKPDKIQDLGFHPVRLNREKEKRGNKVSVYCDIFILTHNRSENQIRHDDTVFINICMSELVGFRLDLNWNLHCLLMHSLPSVQTRLG